MSTAKKHVVKAQMPSTVYIVKADYGELLVFTKANDPELVSYADHVVGIYKLEVEGIKKVKVIFA